MKMNQLNVASLMLLAAAKDAATATPTEVSSAAPAVPESTPEAEVKTEFKNEVAVTPEHVTHVFVGIDYSAAQFTKLENQWRSAHGRIKAAVSDRMDYLLSLDPEADDRKKSKLKSGRNVVDDIQLTTNPKAVVAVAKEMLANKLITSGDANVWVAYVTLAEAFRMAQSLGRL